MKISALFLMAAVALPLLAQQDGSIVARGKPGNAGVFVDGKYVGPASRFTVPEKYKVEPGEREITIRDPRYEDYTTKVTIAPKKKTTIKYSLKPATPAQGPFGTLRLGGDGAESFMSVAAGDTGAVFLNDRFYGYVDELNNRGSGLLLPPGTYRLRIENSAFNMNRDITITANQTTVVELTKQ
jgi:hypothetical protein